MGRFATKKSRKGHTNNPNGRPVGVRNKATIERDERAKQLLALEQNSPSALLRLGKDQLAIVMDFFAVRADAAARRLMRLGLEPPDEPRAGDKAAEKRLKDWERAERRAVLLMEKSGKYAAELAQYQSPRLAAVAIQPVNPYAGMSDAELFAEVRRKQEALRLEGPVIEGKAEEPE